MKALTKKLIFSIPTLFLVVLCVVLVVVTLNGREKDVAAMKNVDGSETVETNDEPPVIPPSSDEPDGEETTAPEEEPEIVSLGLTYSSLGDGRALVSGIGSCRDSVILLPTKTPDGDIVTGISEYAFRGLSFVKRVEIPDSVTTIGEYAFYGSGIETVYLPATVRSVGDYAFAGCASLTDIRVDADNPEYSDIGGVFFNKKGTVLITYPAGRSDSYITLSADVNEIRTMAFYRSEAIKMVHYLGSYTSFRRIRIGAGNEVIEEAVITYPASEERYGLTEREK